MKEKILENIDKPEQLEKLYRSNKIIFKSAFQFIYPDIQENQIAQVWNERLNFENNEISWGTKSELIFVLVASLLAGFIAKIPAFFNISEEFYYPRNIGFIIFPILSAYFFWKQKINTKKLIIVSVAFLIAVFYINWLPNDTKSDTLILACIHLPLFLWTVSGFTYIGEKINDFQSRLDFLRFNGDLVVMCTIIIIAGFLLTGITLGLFMLIDIKIEEFYFQYIQIFEVAATPMIATYLVQTNPQLVNKVSPVIAKIFTPLVLVTLIVYLLAVIWTGKDPYNDREFLLIFNLLLIGVMAIILFSIAEISKNKGSNLETVLLFLLSSVTIILNGIVLSAILFRIAEWGVTPNRLAVLGSNLLILTNLLLMTFRLFRSVKNRDELINVENSIAKFLPIYTVWTIIVTFIFPLLFNFK